MSRCRKLQFQPLSAEVPVLFRVVELPRKHHLCKVKSLNKGDANSEVTVYYQVGILSQILHNMKLNRERGFLSVLCVADGAEEAQRARSDGADGGELTCSYNDPLIMILPTVCKDFVGEETCSCRVKFVLI